MRDFSKEPVTPAEQAALDQLSAAAHAAGNASVAANPSDPSFWMLFDGRITHPVVHQDGCYICEDPEYGQMGLPLCCPCPACLRAQRGLGHIPADDTVCTECGEEHGPGDYDENGDITGISAERNLALKMARHPERYQ
jgi:hypothetical protein